MARRNPTRFDLVTLQEYSTDMPTPRVLMLIVLVFAAASARLLPHLHNLAPMTAVTLFAAAYLPSRRWSVFLPLVAMFLSDVVLYATKDVAYRDQALSNMLFVYPAFAVVAGLGQWLRGRVTVGRAIGTALACSVVFFLITNFGAWLTLSRMTPPMYSQTFSGLIDCYIAGVPFFRGTFAGDLLYTAALFGGIALLERRAPQASQSLVQPTR